MSVVNGSSIDEKRWPATAVEPVLNVRPQGVRTLAIRREFGDIATVVAAFPAGSLFEPGLAPDGAASVLSRIIPYGTASYPDPAALAEAIEGIGGAFGADATDDLARIWATVPADQLEAAARIVGEMAVHPLLPAQAVAREREVLAGRLRAAAAEPSARASELLGTLLWPSSPLGRTYEQQAKAVEQLEQADAVAFHRSQYAGEAAVLGAAAPASVETINRVLEGVAAHWFPGTPRGVAPVAGVGDRFAHAAVESELAYLALGARAVPFNHPDRYALNLLAVVLGSGMTSRLFLEVREKRGLCYGIGARLSLHHTAGAFSVQAGVPPERLAEAMSAILEQLHLAQSDITETEVQRAKALIRGSLAMESDNVEQGTSRYVSDILAYGRPRLAREIIAALEPIGPAELGHIAEKYLAVEHLHLGIAGTFAGDAPGEHLLMGV